MGSEDFDYDLDMYDEDGLLREDKETDVFDKSNLINSMQKILKVKKKGGGTIRREAAKDAAEFVAIKRRSGPATTLNKLLATVKDSGEEKTVDKVSKLVKAASVKPVKTLEAPLEKPQALKAKRAVLYENAKEEVSRWNAIVYHNRNADQIVYPLNAGTKAKKKTTKELANDFIPMTPLEEEMARVLYGEEYLIQKKAEMAKPSKPSDSEAYLLSVEEAMTFHSEMSRLRALQSYQMIKAKRQNKIKSKKYHRLLRKEKIRKQLKEFQELQQQDPDAAMEKLDELNKSRVEERMSLKHRNTSKWAKMQAARAKYNKDSREALSEQLKIRRQLTQKVQESSDESDDPDLELPSLVKSSLNNPWMLNSEVKDNAKMQLYYSGYKKLWEQINAKKQKELENNKNGQSSEDEAPTPIVEKFDDPKGKEDSQFATNTLSITKKKKLKRLKKSKTNKTISQNDGALNTSKLSQSDIDDNVEFNEQDLEIMIMKAEDKMRSDATKELKKLTKEEKRHQRLLERGKKIKLKQSKKTKKQREGDADEVREFDINPESQLLENGEDNEDSSKQLNLTALREKETKFSAKSGVATIDPSNFLKITKKKDANKITFSAANISQADFNLNDDDSSSEDDNDTQRQLIAEAFEDDDVVSSFQKRKQDTIDASKPQDIDLSLPGWGEWGGKGIQTNPRKRQKFIIKAPPQTPRKDAKLSHVILNEEAGDKMREHQVRELPFPFKSVKDFEKTIRAPVGRTFLPESSMKSLTAPKIITRLGAIIEPLDEELLVQKKNKDLKVPISIKRMAHVRKT